MSQHINGLYEFGSFQLNRQERLLRRGGVMVTLTPKAFDLLLALVERHGRLVEKEELFKVVWPDSFVEESNLSSNVALIRKALGDGTNGERYIETVPKRGYRFIADVRVHSAKVTPDSEGPHIGSLAGVPPILLSPAVPRRPVRRNRALMLIALGLFAGIVAMGGIAWRRSHRSPIPRLMPFTTLPGRESDMTFSPDGNQLAFTWDGGERNSPLHIYVKQIGNEEVRQLTHGSDQEISPSWSPDGSEIAFIRWSAQGRSLHVIPSLGGAARSINNHRFHFSARLSWTPDGKGLVMQGNNTADEPRSLYYVVRETGEMRKLTAPPAGSYGDRFPALSPDGKLIVFCRATTINQSELFLLPLSGGEPKQLTFDQADTKWPVWTPDGSEIIFISTRRNSNGTVRKRLWRMSVRGKEPHAIEISGNTPDAPAISRQGNRLAWAEDVNDFNIWQLELSPTTTQTPRPFLTSTKWEDSPQYSPDGSKIAFASDRSGSMEIWVCNSEGKDLLQLTHSNYNGSPRWSPDGQQIVYDSVAEGNAEIYVISATGGSPRRLTNNPAEDIVPSWSRDGRWIYFCSNRGGSQQIWKMPATSGPPVQITKQGGFDNIESPDGQYVYYLKGRLQPGIWRVPTAGGEETLVLDRNRAGYWRHWAVTEQGIYYATAQVQNNYYPLIEFYNFATGQIKTILTLEKRIFPTPPGLAVSPDGRRLLWSQLDQEGSDIVLLENFR